MELVPLKIKTTKWTEHTKDNSGDHYPGEIRYPDFNQISADKRQHMDWSQFIANFGEMVTDRVSGHDQEDAESPRGVWWIMCLVPEDFALEAESLFPQLVEIVSQADAQTFYETRATINEPDEKVDVEVLQAIKLKQDLNIPLTATDNDAINPDKETPGVVKNKRKKMADYIATKGITIKDRVSSKAGKDKFNV